MKFCKKKNPRENQEFIGQNLTPPLRQILQGCRKSHRLGDFVTQSENVAINSLNRDMRGNICLSLLCTSLLIQNYQIEFQQSPLLGYMKQMYSISFKTRDCHLPYYSCFLKKSDSRGTGEPLGKSKFGHVLFLLEEFLKIEKLFILIVQQYMVIQLQSKPVRTIADRFC